MSYVASQSMLIPMTWSILKGGMWGPISSSGSSSVRSYHVTYKDQIRHGKYVLQRGVFRAVSKTHLKGMGPQFPNFWRLPHDVHTIWPRMIKFCTEIRVEKRFQDLVRSGRGPTAQKFLWDPLFTPTSFDLKRPNWVWFLGVRSRVDLGAKGGHDPKDEANIVQHNTTNTIAQKRLPNPIKKLSLKCKQCSTELMNITTMQLCAECLAPFTCLVLWIHCHQWVLYRLCCAKRV